MEAVRQIENALSALRVPSVPGGEYDIHRLVAGALTDADIAFEHEVSLAPRCRIDFLVGSVGLEVKRGAVPARRLCAQAARYLASDRLSALIVIATRGVRLPADIGGKPVYVLGLNRLWGVALP